MSLPVWTYCLGRYTSRLLLSRVLPGSHWSECDVPFTEERKTLSQISTSVNDFADFQIALSGTSFPTVGSLSLHGEIGPFMSMSKFCKPDPPYFSGPFRSTREYYLAHVTSSSITSRSASSIRTIRSLRIWFTWSSEALSSEVISFERGRRYQVLP